MGRNPQFRSTVAPVPAEPLLGPLGPNRMPMLRGAHRGTVDSFSTVTVSACPSESLEVLESLQSTWFFKTVAQELRAPQAGERLPIVWQRTPDTPCMGGPVATVHRAAAPPSFPCGEPEQTTDDPARQPRERRKLFQRTGLHRCRRRACPEYTRIGGNCFNAWDCIRAAVGLVPTEAAPGRYLSP